MITTTQELIDNIKIAYKQIENKNYASALDQLNKCVAVDPEPLNVNALGYVYYEMGDYKRALNVFNQILDAYPEFEMSQKNFVETVCKMDDAPIRDIKMAISFSPDCVSLWIKLANEYDKIREITEEINTLRLATYIFPTNIDVHKLFGRILAKYQFVESAKREYEFICKLSPNDKESIEQLQKLSANTYRKQINIGLLMGLDPVMHKICDGLFIGSESAAYNIKEMKKHNITHILNVANNVANVFEFSNEISIKYLHMCLVDTVQCDILKNNAINICVDFIENTLKNNGNILVHCQAGMSRSGTIIVAYLMKHFNLSFADALTKAKTCRQCVHPNYGFVKQLEEWEKIEK